MHLDKMENMGITERWMSLFDQGEVWLLKAAMYGKTSGRRQEKESAEGNIGGVRKAKSICITEHGHASYLRNQQIVCSSHI